MTELKSGQLGSAKKEIVLQRSKGCFLHLVGMGLDEHCNCVAQRRQQ